MASYAALVSLKTTVKTIQYHPNPPISLDNQQADAFMEKITFLQAFLEDYSHREDRPTDGLESRIADTASPAEGAIESYIADTIGGFANHVESNHRYDRFYQDLQRYIEEMDIIMKEAKVIKEMMTGDDNEQLVGFSAVPSQASSSPGQTTTAVGFDEALVQVLEKLEADHQSNRQIIPIVGMGGIGKTTLAIEAYEHPRVALRFDALVWVTISQRFKIREILLQIIHQRKLENEEDLSHMSEEELGLRIYQNLFGRRYLIVMDDLWSSEAWDQIRDFFPKNDNSYGSRVIVTTRNEDIAFQLSSRDGDDIQYMKLFNDDESWNLFCKTVFEEDPCPLELEEIGKIIVRNCKGLPLSIVVTGGFLTKSEKTKQHWEDVAKNLDASVSVEVHEQCSKILNLSYRQLPIQLKSCFLYIGVVYPEDAKIPVSVLIKLLVAEGFLETKGDDILEDVVREYIDDLVDRNLVMVDHLGSTSGNIRVCKMHDLVRDFCVREAQKQKLLCIVEAGNPNSQCGENNLRLRAPLVRSLIWESDKEDNESLTFRYSRVLVRTRVAVASTDIAQHFPAVSQFSNSRFLVFHCIPPKRIFSTMPVIWNLQTLIIKVIWKLQTQGWVTEALEIWKMPRLRHVKMPRLNLPSPPDDDTVLQNLQTLCYVREFKCTDDVVKRVPNVRKLGINCCEHSGSYSDLCLNNLQHLKKLENLRIELPLWGPRCAENLYAFPESLTKLVLFGGAFHFEDVSGKIGSLPFLGKLELNSLSGTEWTLDKEQFSSLESLSIFQCEELKYWGASDTHFPVLNDLTLTGLEKLEKIHSDIGEIPTLHLLVVNCCSNSAVDSAKAIAEEQESENSVLKVHVVLTKENMQLESCQTSLQNFVVVQEEEANTVEMIMEKCIIPEESSSEECRVEEDGRPQSERNTKHHSSPQGESSCSAPIQYKKQRTSSPSP